MIVLFMNMVVVLLLQFKIHNKDKILFVIADALRERFNANKNVPPVDESDSNDTDESDSLMILKILIIGYIHHCVVGFACL
ncbi:hypothetical protein HanPI659440_Chr11g0408591 [Helianthus annuus]|nr:hypothetical protein HanPI659440_Chr11g0408591 [Helianthus annuus]